MAVIYDVIVVGGGIIGSCSAYWLAKQGKHVLLLEQFPLPHTRGSSHGQSRIIHKAYEEKVYTQMMMEADPMYRQIERESGATLMKTCDHLIFGEEGYDDIENTTMILKETGCRHEYLSPGDLRGRFPMVNFEANHAGVLDQEAGVLHADRCVSTIQGLLKKLGGELHDKEKVEDISPGQIVQVITNRGQYRSRSLIITPGSWVLKVLQPLGLHPPIQPTAVTVGYWRQKSEGRAYSLGSFPSFVATHGGRDDRNQPLHMYGLPADEYPDMVRIGFHGGQPVDPDRRDASPVNHDIEAMKVFVRSHFPGLEDFPSITERCIISVTPDEGIIIDHHPKHKNIIIGAGFSGYGFAMAPVIGKILGQLATGEIPKYNIKGFKLDRFSRTSKL